MNNFVVANNKQSMTSREIADLVESRHDVVKKSIERLMERGIISHPPLADGIKSANGTVEKHYLIGKRDSYIIVAQLSPEFTAKLVDRWQELESNNAFAIPTTLSGALRLASEQAEQLEAQSIMIAEQKPKVAALDRISKSTHENNLRDAAKVLQIKPGTMSGWLASRRWISKGNGKHWFPLQPAIDAGYMITRENEQELEDGSVKIRPQAMVTQKGVQKLALMLSNDPMCNHL